MTEGVETGGVKKFVYGKAYNPKLSSKEKKELEEAYSKAAIRKEKERRRKLITWISIVLGIVLLVILGLLFIR